MYILVPVNWGACESGEPCPTYFLPALRTALGPGREAVSVGTGVMWAEGR